MQPALYPGIEAGTGTHLWAERYDRPLDDIFALQDEITLSVVGAIEPSLREAEIERVRRKRPDSLDTYDIVLRALPHVYLANSEEAAKALPFLESALALEAQTLSAPEMTQHTDIKRDDFAPLIAMITRRSGRLQ